MPDPEMDFIAKMRAAVACDAETQPNYDHPEDEPTHEERCEALRKLREEKIKRVSKQRG